MAAPEHSIEPRPAAQMSWGRVFRHPQPTLPVGTREGIGATLEAAQERPLLPHGEGRSYGDVCLAKDGVCLDLTGLNRVLSFDAERGVIECEAGCTIAQLLEFLIPRGWFVPVTPGTKFVTIGGAVANDVHGKNHHCAGTFGCHVLAMEVWRTGEGVCRVGPEDALFAATVAGLGLTGLILTVTFQCIPITSSLIDKESIKMRGVEDFFALTEESDGKFDYTVAWIDCLAPRQSLGRGEFYRGNHAAEGSLDYALKRSFAIPFELPFRAINHASILSFNFLYRLRQRKRTVRSIVGLDPFFYPLDGLEHWNRLYGRTGLFQFQSVIPVEAKSVVRDLLQAVSDAGTGSPLVVLKQFGSDPSPGMLSFPREGFTLAIDFPNLGERVRALLARLEAISLDAGGRLYPAKDAVMAPESFHAGYPRWAEFEKFIDPGFSSDFFLRVK